MNTACITGCTGQIGSFLVDLLLSEGYKVYGLKRRSASLNTGRIDHAFDNPNLKLVYGDVTDYASIESFVSNAKPDIFINCAAQSHVKVSFDIPLITFDATGKSVVNCLEAIKTHSPSTKFITMSSSEMFGSSAPPQNELTTFHPRSIYGVAKLAGYYATINYREAYGLHCSNAICFNTESPRRGETFVTRKITLGAARIKLGLQDKLYLGNMSAKRDWSHATDTSNAIYKIIQAPRPADYVIASGETHSVEEFAQKVFSKLDLDYKQYIEIDPKYYRPSEVDVLLGDASKIKKELGWTPKYTFDMLVDEMVEADMKLALNEKLIQDNK